VTSIPDESRTGFRKAGTATGARSPAGSTL
jgi:hypothetical protein